MLREKDSCLGEEDGVSDGENQAPEDVDLRVTYDKFWSDWERCVSCSGLSTHYPVSTEHDPGM